MIDSNLSGESRRETAPDFIISYARVKLKTVLSDSCTVVGIMTDLNPTSL